MVYHIRDILRSLILGTNLHIDIRQVAKAEPVARRHFLIKQSKDFREI
jgi:hypothetical protein